MKRCTCTGIVASNAIGDADKGRVYDAMQSFCGRVRDGDIGGFDSFDKDIAGSVSEIYGCLSLYHTDREKFETVATSLVEKYVCCFYNRP